MPSVEPGGNCSWPGLLTTRRTPFWPFAVGVVRTRARAERAGERRRGAAPGARNVLEPEAAAIVREKMSARDALLRLLKRSEEKKNARSLAMARAIESLVATAGAAIEKLQAHATSARALEAEARARLDALPPSADDDLPGVVKTRATLRVVCRSLHARLRETLRALEGARAAVDAALLAHHRGKTHVPGVAARPPEDGSSDSGDVRAFAASLARIVEEAEEDGLFAPLPRLPASSPRRVANETETVIEPRAREKSLEIETDITHLPDALFAELSLSLGAGARRADPATLRLVVATLAAAERDVDARAALAHEIETRFRVSGTSPGTSPGTSYSSENFAYGTTSLRAWTRVVAACPALAAAMRALARDAERDAATFAEDEDFFFSENVGGGPSHSARLRRLEERSRCVVFGSSTGWLVFYAALAHGVRSVGYELLEGRVATARATARTAFSFSSKARRACSWVGLLAFSSSDATLAPLGVGAKVVVLTSQCWDESLKTRVAERLASELKPGALVVDYGERLAREPAFGEPIAVVEAPTSWNAKQRFYVFQKREMTAVSEASE